MDITITDLELLARFMQATDVVNIKGPDGRTVVCLMVKPNDDPTITEQRIAEMMQEYPKGRPTADILADLRKRYGL